MDCKYAIILAVPFSVGCLRGTNQLPVDQVQQSGLRPGNPTKVTEEEEEQEVPQQKSQPVSSFKSGSGNACNEFDTSNPDLWSYFTAQNYGVRADGGGGGWFDAPRRGASNGHAGIDFLAEKNQQICSPCNGRYLAGYDDGFGNWVQVICKLPGESAAISVLFAHLARYSPHVQAQVNSGSNSFVNVVRGKPLGYAGNSGNAESTLTHVHIETILKKSLSAAESESHAGFQMNLYSTTMLSKLYKTCVTNKGISFKLSKSFNVGANLDPYLLMRCLSQAPALNRKLLGKKGYEQSLGWDKIYQF